MTKIKDLAVITVENVFLMFPLDVERYELRDVVDEFLSDRNVIREGGRVLPGGNDRINRFVLMADDVLVACAKALRKVDDEPGKRHSAIMADRARRVRATLSEPAWDQGGRYTRKIVACEDVLVHSLWDAVLTCWDKTETRLNTVCK